MKVHLRTSLFTSLCFLLTTLFSLNSQAQSPCPNSNCVSGDIRITEVKLVQNDAPTYSALPNSCNPNQLNVPVALKVTFDVISQDRYGFMVIADVWITDPNSANPTTAYKAGKIAQCYPDTFSQGLNVKYVSKYVTQSNIIWPCGSTIQLRDVYTAWDNQVATQNHPSVCSYLNPTTGALTQQSCKTIAPKCKFYGSNESISVISPLIVDFTTSGTCPAGNTVQRIAFTNTTTGGVSPYSVSWDFGDGTAASTAASPTHDYATAGNYTVTLTVTDNSLPTAQTISASKSVTVQACCSQSSYTTQPSPVIQCTGTAASFTIAYTGGSPGPSIKWQQSSGGSFTDLNNAGVFSNVTTVTLNISNIAGLDGNEYRAVLTNGACAAVYSNIALLTVNPKPTAGISGTTAVCKDGTSPNITFTGSGGTTPYTFNYTLNDVAQSVSTTGNNTSVTVPVPTGTAGSFVYALTGVSDANCSNTASGSATVTVYPKATAEISGTTAVCKDATSPLVTFTGSGGTKPYTFNYTLNGSAQTVSTTGNNASVTVSASTATATTLTYVLTGISDANCTNTASGSAVITINPPPATPTVTVVQPTCGNSNGSVTVTNPVDNGTDYEYRNGNGSWTENTVFAVVANASYSIVARNKATLCISDPRTGTMGAQGSAPDMPTIGVKTYASCSSSNMTVEVTAPLGDYKYSNNDGAWQTSPEFVIKAGAGYSIKARSNADITCISAAATCAAEPPGITGRSNVEESGVIDNLVEGQTTVKAFPNPFSDKIKFVINSTVAGKGTLEVFNMSGQKLRTIYNGMFTAGTQTFELNLPVLQFANLVYVLRIGDKKLSGALLQTNH